MSTLLLKLMPVLTKAEPFLKWAGGKRQLISQISCMLPVDWTENRPRKYIEPMVGGGALFFYLAGKYELDEKVICDINKDLILTYQTIQKEPEALINELQKLDLEYHSREKNEQKDLFYQIRQFYNESSYCFDYTSFNDAWIQRAGQLMFLNHTCYNGLYRVNAKGLFNVPFGGYPAPKICDPVNIRNVNTILIDTIILQGDYENCERYVDENTLVYFDPPYRPLSKTASFTSYASNFDDNEQRRLAEFYRYLAEKNPKLMLSNSDPHNIDPNDNFMEMLYRGFRIERVPASRMINSQGDKRGIITEILVMNY